MPIRCEHSVEVKASPERAFSLLDDLPQTPKWLESCTAIEKLSSGPNSVGDKLKYAYKQDGRAGTMQGEILTREPNNQLVCRYLDAMMEVVVDFRISSAPGGARLTHVITVTPLTFMGKMMAPVIGMALPKQTRKAMESLKAILDTA